MTTNSCTPMMKCENVLCGRESEDLIMIENRDDQVLKVCSVCACAYATIAAFIGEANEIEN